MKVLEEFKTGKPVMDIVQQFRISKSQVYEIRKRKDSIAKYAASSSSKHSKIIKKAAKYPAIDSTMFKWFCSVRALIGTRKPLPISRAMIKSRAMLEAKRQVVTKFSASDGWFSHWRWCFDISKCVKLHGEAGEVDLKAAEHEFQKLRIEIGKYPPSNVFNMDKAGLFFKAIPNRSYIL